MQTNPTDTGAELEKLRTEHALMLSALRDAEFNMAGVNLVRQPWAERVAHFSNPTGNSVTLCGWDKSIENIRDAILTVSGKPQISYAGLDQK